MQVVPELLCSDIEATKHFYVGLLGFEIKHERPEEKFAYFTREGIDLMCEEIHGPGRRWHTGDMDLPLGRGVNFQWEVSRVSELYDRVKELSPESIYLELEEASYRCGDQVVNQQQFVVQDPDGYLFRFCDMPGPNGT